MNNEYIVYGDMDLRGMKALKAYTEEYNIISLHAQQAVEKYLKGLLLYKVGVQLKTHSLLKIYRELGDNCNYLHSYVKELAYLQNFFYQVRYPSEDSIVVSKNEADECVRICEEIIGIIKDNEGCNSPIRGLNLDK